MGRAVQRVSQETCHEQSTSNFRDKSLGVGIWCLHCDAYVLIVPINYLIMSIRYCLLGLLLGFIPGVLAQNTNVLSSSIDTLDTLARSKDTLAEQTLLDQVLISTKRLAAISQEQANTILMEQELISTFSGQSVAAMLNQIGGIEMSGATGHSGQNLGYYVRGGNNRQVLIMVDGAVVSDASGIATDFDLRLLPVDQIESISIVRGPSSVLYGSGAATAVIYIKTKQYNAQKPSLVLEQSLGSNRSVNQSPLSGIQQGHSARFAMGQGPWVIQAQASGRFTDGLSAIAASENERAFDPDQFSQFNTRVQIKYRSKKRWSMQQFFAYDQLRQDFDNFNYQDALFQSATKQWRTGGSFYFVGKDSRYEFHDQWSHIHRDINSDYPAAYRALNYNADQFIATRWNNQFESVLGTQGGWSSMDLAQSNGASNRLSTVLSHGDTRTYFIDSYVNLSYKPLASISIDFGGRWHHHMRYGNQGVYQISPRYSFANLWGDFSLYGRYGTAFIAPSLYQLYDPIYGNQDLKPEFNKSTELGMVWQKNRLKWAIRWFQRYEEQAVIFALLDPELFVYQYANNLQDQRRSGIEIETEFQAASWINWHLFYTWVNAHDFELLRIPAHKVNLHGDFTLSDSEKLSLRWTWADARRDQFFDSSSFTNQNISLNPYHWVDVVYGVRLSPALNAQLSVTNLLNQEAQPLHRYSGQGRNLLLSLTWQSQ